MRIPDNPMHPIQTFDEVITKYATPEIPLDAPRIPEFYAGREIFLTGGSGFVGKVLIEKLLRSCPDIAKIYLLLRPKKGKNVEERLEEIIKNPLFDIMRLINSNFNEKLIPIVGDVGELGLGMSSEDVERMKNVSVIFHSAATVRFDDTLKKAVLINTRGTREVMEFAMNLINLKSIIHVSTTYSNVYIHELEERIYAPVADWKKTIEVCETLDDDLLDIMTQHYISFMPNTYVFSKNLAEHVSDHYKKQLPVVLFRPSVVTGIDRKSVV